MMKKSILHSLVFYLLSFAYVMGQNVNQINQQNLVEAQKNFDNRDYDKAILLAQLYQKDYEKMPKEWLMGQNLIIRCYEAKKDYGKIEPLLKAAERVINQGKINDEKVLVEFSILQGRDLEVKNRFEDAEKIYRDWLNKRYIPNIAIRLGHNLIDRLLSGRITKGEKSDEAKYLREVREIFAKYAQINERDPLELNHLQMKINGYTTINQKLLTELENQVEYWGENVDEHLILSIYFNNALRQYEKSYELWSEKHEILNQMTHPAVIPTLAQLALNFTGKNNERSEKIVKSMEKLVRDNIDREIFLETKILLQINQQKLTEADKSFAEFKRNFKESTRLDLLKVILLEAYLKEENFEVVKKLIGEIEVEKLSDSQLKGRIKFAEATMSLAKGKNKEAANLFMQIGEILKNSPKGVEAILEAGKAFLKAGDAKQALNCFERIKQESNNLFKEEIEYYLAEAYAVENKFAEAIELFAKIEKNLSSQNNEFRKKALLKRGDLELKIGEKSKAVEIYYEYVQTYDNDPQVGSVMIKAFEIYREEKNFAKGGEILDRILQKEKIDQGTKAFALLHKGLLAQMDGKLSDSIKYWRQYLQNYENKDLKSYDEVQLLLAATYEREEVLNLGEASKLYEKVIHNSKSAQNKFIAIERQLNLLKDKRDETLEKLISITSLNIEIEENITNILLTSIFSFEAKKLAPYQNKIFRFIQQLKKINQQHFWQFRYQIFFKEIALEQVEKELNQFKNVPYKEMSLSLLRESYLTIENREKACQFAVEMIYYQIIRLEKNGYCDWQELARAAKVAVSNLEKSKGEKIRDRLKKNHSPQTIQIIDDIEKILKDKP